MMFNRIFATTIWCQKWDSLDVPSGPESRWCLAIWTEQFHLYRVGFRERGQPLSWPGELHWNWEKRMSPWRRNHHSGKRTIKLFYIGINVSEL